MKLDAAIEGYVAHKRSGRLVYQSAASELRAFGKRVGNVDLGEISTSQILGFLNNPRYSTHTWRRKYAQLRDFFHHWYILGIAPVIKMPPPRGLERPSFIPYVYTRTEVRALVSATGRVPRNAKGTIPAETLRTLLLLVYGTGARTSEAITLLSDDVDLRSSTIRFRENGVRCARVVPIGPDIRRVLRQYSRWKRSVGLTGKFFLVRRDDSQVQKDALYHLFRKLLRTAVVARRDKPNHPPRICDLRATFAVHQITSWIRKGKDLNRLLPALSAYLGQMDLGAAERYLTLTADRFRKELNKLSPQKGQSWSKNPEMMRFLSSLDGDIGASLGSRGNVTLP